MLGIIIGVGSVIIIISVGAGAQSLIVNELSAYGTDLFAVLPGAAKEKGPPAAAMGIIVTTLKASEVKDIEKIPYVKNVTAYVKGTGTAIYGNQKAEVNFVGTTNEIVDVESLDIAQGRFFTREESKSLARVIVLGSQIKKDLFGDSDALGKNIKLKKYNFKVIGVMDHMGTKALENKDTQVYIPISTAQKLILGINHISMIRGKVDDAANLPFVTEEIKTVIRRHHNISNPLNDDFTVRSMDQAIDILGSITDALRFFLAGIAAISLLVGGVGIMNIMLVNITERTKEIGLRKSVGATPADILKQFLAESATLTVFSGSIGIIGGILFSWMISLAVRSAGYDWDFIVTLSSIVLAFGVSAAIGLIFGSYPAKKAAKMEPVEALRAE